MINVIEWAHKLLAEVLCSGDLAIDLTAGHGHDTLWLAQQVEAIQYGQVLAFDIQQSAIDSTAERVVAAGYVVYRGGQQSDTTTGITLHHCCHGQLSDKLQQLPATVQQLKGVIANFGYLPNGDHATTTVAASSCIAIKQAAECLAPGGRIALVIYTGHPGAMDEANAIESLCCQLQPQKWKIVRIQPINRCNAPYLLMLEKRK